MKFRDYLNLLEATETFTDEHGSHHYISDVGNHKVGVHFHPRGTDRYEVGVDVNGSDLLKAREGLSTGERQQAILTAMAHIRHFTKTKSPLEYFVYHRQPEDYPEEEKEEPKIAKAKQKFYFKLMNKLSERTPGSQVIPAKHYSRILFPPNEEQRERISSIKKANLIAMKAAAAKRAAANMSQ